MKIGIESEKDRFGKRAVGVMLNEKNRVLLCQVEGDPIWVLPGGNIGLHETLQETVEREFFEETNFEVEVQRLLWILENYFIFKGTKTHSIEFYFLVKPKEAAEVGEQDEFLGQGEQHSPDRSWMLDPNGLRYRKLTWFEIPKLNEVNFKPTILKELLKDIPTHPMHVVWDTYGRYVRTVPMKFVIESEKDWFGLRATGVILDGKNRVLLCQLEGDDLWVLPGGGIGLHETLQETVERELFEEANFEIKVQRLLWIIENFFIFHAKKHHVLEFYFLVTPKEPTGIWEQDEFEGQEDFLGADNFWNLPEGRTLLHFKWFDISKLNEINFKPTILTDLLKQIPKQPMHIVWDTYGRNSDD